MRNVDQFFKPKPWLELFKIDFPGLIHRHDAPVLQTENAEQTSRPSGETIAEKEGERDEQSPSVHLLSLPSEILFTVFSLCEAEQLSTLAQVSRGMLPYAYDPRHWRRIAIKMWPKEAPHLLERKLHQYKTWRQLCTQRPRLRTNAIFVVRHQFAKTSSRFASEEPVAPVFLVTYHRFLRFYTDGTVVSLVSPEMPHLVVRRVRRGRWASPGDKDQVSPSVGTYQFDEDALSVSLTLPMCHPRFPDMRSGTVYMHLNLSSTKSGAFDRLFLNQHYAIMDHNGGDLVPYRVDAFGGKPFRLIPIWGFRSNVYREFPRDDDADLAQWFEMKKARGQSKKNPSASA